MDVKAFVSETIQQIAAGMIESQEKSPHTIVNPAGARRSYVAEKDKRVTGSTPTILTYFGKVQDIDFDIAVSVASEQSAEAGAKVRLYVASGGGEGKRSRTDTTISRIRFKIPVQLPYRLPTTKPGSQEQK